MEAEDGKLMIIKYNYHLNPLYMTRTGNTIKMSENKDGNFSMFEVESGNPEEECMDEITKKPKRAIEKSNSKDLISSGITYNETMDIIGPFIRNKSPIALKASAFLGLKGVFYKPSENSIVSPNVFKFWLFAYFNFDKLSKV